MIRSYNEFIESDHNPVVVDGKDHPIKVFGFAHCGVMGTLNRNDREDLSLKKQIRDWHRMGL